MNKSMVLISAITILTLSACTQELSDKDRAFLWETRTLAQTARDEAAKATENANFSAASAQRAAEDADNASEAAAVAAGAAQESGEKSDRIFRQNLKK